MDCDAVLQDGDDHAFGARGTVALSSFTNYFYGIRLYGD